MGETCEVCGLELASIETRNLLHAGELVRYGEYRGKCVRDASCLQRGYDREKARADAADAGWDKADATVEKLANDFATITELSNATIARLQADLAAARRECEGLKALLREAQIALSTVGCIPEGEQHAQEVLRKLEAALAAPAAGEEG